MSLTKLGKKFFFSGQKVFFQLFRSVSETFPVICLKFFGGLAKLHSTSPLKHFRGVSFVLKKKGFHRSRASTKKSTFWHKSFSWFCFGNKESLFWKKPLFSCNFLDLGKYLTFLQKLLNKVVKTALDKSMGTLEKKILGNFSFLSTFLDNDQKNFGLLSKPFHLA